MHVISRKPFIEAAINNPRDATALIAVLKVLESNSFSSPEVLRQIFPSLDNFKYRNKWWVIDIGGNNLRLIAFINFVSQCVFVKHIVTHAEYDKLTKYYREHKE
ncbi:mRNA interferase HigB|uniref:mRNA interferase HigB n=1 Tax=Brenneria salicis ATCC 15712 = DSM 30166 TaxID=714314 RepID=A0A366I160_9GAMM|nr:type II toxin-antitoxin system HigB family toxin [Brenneria salicis]NMN92122.1 mRNA interferase HigB [Brenneria salicis ATCC 15712 = DSM 30166]RBP61112.1 mRNA interferase HigB [Brenneria salicis ATCC 15712 = DSM 30166]RLM29808.1 cytoplasmic protein [Brenneria salicis ATCC 15712 = DSM 30166]